jgi:large subunit ribosomal protein L25
VWEGEPKPKVAGSDIGNRLYAGKKRMFKGHKWERTRAKRDAKRAMLLRSMKQRLIRYKGVSSSDVVLVLCPVLMRF